LKEKLNKILWQREKESCINILIIFFLKKKLEKKEAKQGVKPALFT